MSDTPSVHVERMLGSYVLGQLPPEHVAEVRRHLESCRRCRRELHEIRPVAQLLPMADAERVMNQPTAPSHVESQLFARIATERRRQVRNTRFVTSGLAIAAVVLAAFLVVPAFTGTSQPGRSVSFVAAPANVAASGRVVDEAWGTQIHLKVSGLSGRQTVWFEQPDGSRASAGSFTAIDGQPVDLVMSTSFKTANAVALCVSPPDAPPVLRAPLTA